MTDLPVLEIGCGTEVVTPTNVTTVCKVRGWLCSDCRFIQKKVLPVLKAHAAAYQKDADEYREAAKSLPRAMLIIAAEKIGVAEGARDAVMGLLPKELKEEER